MRKDALFPSFLVLPLRSFSTYSGKSQVIFWHDYQRKITDASFPIIRHSGDTAIAARLFVLSRLALLANVVGELASKVKHLKGLFWGAYIRGSHLRRGTSYRRGICHLQWDYSWGIDWKYRGSVIALNMPTLNTTVVNFIERISYRRLHCRL